MGNKVRDWNWTESSTTRISHVSKVLIEHFHKVVDLFERQKLVVLAVNAHNEIQARVSAEYNSAMRYYPQN